MNEEQPKKRKILFSVLALVSLSVSLVLAGIADSRFDQGEELAGYGGLGIIISFLVALLLSGLILGQIALIRGEKPVAVPILALTLNAGVFIALLIHMPR